jgi:hypothetical protein
MAPKYETRARERIRKGLPKYIAILDGAAKRGVKEGDTSDIVRSMLTELLGYEAFREVNAQFRVKGRFADWAVYVGNELKYLVEVKPLATKLRESHLSQVESYVRQKPGVGWAVLTTGDWWQCHRIATGRESEMFLEIKLLAPAEGSDRRAHFDRVTDSLYLLSREATARGALEEAWEQTECYRPEMLGAVLVCPDVLRVVRRVVRQQYPGRRVDVSDLKEHIVLGVIRGDISLATLGQPGRAKRRKARSLAPTEPALDDPGMAESVPGK